MNASDFHVCELVPNESADNSSFRLIRHSHTGITDGRSTVFDTVYTANRANTPFAYSCKTRPDLGPDQLDLTKAL